MAIRYVSFTVSEDTTVTPTTPQYGGVQGEHNATELAFIIATTGSLANDNYRYYIECVDAAGGVDRTARLYRHGSEISTPVPLAWTQYGGVSTVRLVAEEDGVVIYSVEGRLQFEDRGSAIEQVDGLLRTDISACMEVSRTAADTAQAAAEAAQAATDDCTDALDDARALADELRAAIDALPPIDTAIAEDVLWSSQHTVETLCPPIDMSGQRVVCYPMENYPLQVTVSRPNYLPFTYAPPIGEQTENGITFTRREDDTILVNGTATADATYYILSGYGEEKNPLVTAGVTAPATLRLSGCPVGGGSDTYCLHYFPGRSNTYNNYGGSTTVSVTAEEVAVAYGWECFIRIKQGVTCDNLVFTPRLEPTGTVRLTRTHGEYEMISELKSLGEMSIMPTNRRMMFSVTPNATLRVRGYGSIPAALAELDGTLDAVEQAVIEAPYALCADFDQTGDMVVCYPAKGSRMAVLAPPGATITRCGKNLWSTTDYHSESASSIIDVTDGVYTRTFKVESTSGTVLSASATADIFNGESDFPAGVYSFSAAPLQTSYLGERMPYLSVTLADGTTDAIEAGATKEIALPFSVTAILCASDSLFPAGYVYTSTFQLERGKPTPYEPYHKETFFADDSGRTSIAASSGANTVFADSGEVTVKGKEDPFHAIDQLKRAVVALGGEVS